MGHYESKLPLISLMHDTLKKKNSVWPQVVLSLSSRPFNWQIIWCVDVCDHLCVMSRWRISYGFLKSRLARPSCRDQNTQEVPRKVDRQDYSQRQQANHRHEQDDVALEGQVCDGVNATFATDFFIPAETERKNIQNLLILYTRDWKLSASRQKHRC